MEVDSTIELALKWTEANALRAHNCASVLLLYGHIPVYVDLTLTLNCDDAASSDLLRLAALTRRGVNGVEWAATGSQMSLPDQASEYDGKYLAKYGCTTQRASIRLNHIVERAQDIRFPNQHDLEPVFELAITGIPDYLLLSMERGLRNYLGREGVRLRWHAREDEPLPGNANAYTEQFELVYTDETGDTLFGFYQNYAARLELGRQAAVREVEREFRFRRRDMQARRATLRQDHKREIERTRAQLLRNEDLEGIRLRQQGLAENVVQDRLDNLRVNHGGTLQRMKERHRAAMSRIEAETPHVNVRSILEQHLVAAGQMH